VDGHRFLFDLISYPPTRASLTDYGDLGITTTEGKSFRRPIRRVSEYFVYLNRTTITCAIIWYSHIITTTTTTTTPFPLAFSLPGTLIELTIDGPLSSLLPQQPLP